VRGAPEPPTAGEPGARVRRQHARRRGTQAVGWWQPPPRERVLVGAPPAPPAAGQRPVRAEAAPGRVRRRAPQSGRAPADALTAPVGPALRGEVLAELDRTSRRRPSFARLLPRRFRTRPRRRLLLHAALALAGAAVLGPVVAFAVGYLLFAVPTPDEAVNNQVSVISFADGSQLTRLVPEQGNRIVVPLAEVPPQVREAVLAAEDRSFYSNPGFDLTGIVRAAWSQLHGGVGGGSTITQQYVKNTLVGDEVTLWRKYREMVVAVKISQERSKDEILGDYLNAIYFGRGAYGIQAASQAYFGRPVSTLTPAEGALLAGMIQSPSRWDPALNPDKAVQRWNFVLDGMVAQGWLSPADRQAAAFPATVPRRPSSAGVPADASGHIVTAVRAELEDLGITEQDLSQAGLRITTTIDPQQQRAAVDAAHAGLAGQPVNLRSAMVAVDPRTGGVLAYYGGDNGNGLDYARVRRLAGSTFKPFVVLAGLQQSPPIGLGEVFDGTARPGLRNAEGAECARCDLKQAMTVSNNVVFSTLARRVGPQRVADAAKAAGITAPLDDPTEGIALGNKEVSTLELASAYATIAAGGVWHPPHLVSRVVTADDRVLYEASPDGERRFPEQVARNVTEAMLAVADRDGLALGRRPVAAKTGTVQSRFPGENNDAWMAGFTPQLASSVWMGTDRNSPIRTATGDPISGRTLPGGVWQGFMASALRDAPPEPFPPFRPLGAPPSDAPPNTAPTSGPAAPAPTAAPAAAGLTTVPADGEDADVEVSTGPAGAEARHDARAEDDERSRAADEPAAPAPVPAPEARVPASGSGRIADPAGAVTGTAADALPRDCGGVPCG
jgi:membrane peptidoglycan carboxypeptidase